jgi:hypothetical protein
LPDDVENEQPASVGRAPLTVLPRQVRLLELYDVVDLFVLYEIPYTHMGADKPLYFNDSISGVVMAAAWESSHGATECQKWSLAPSFLFPCWPPQSPH